MAAENNLVGEVFNVGGGSRITVNVLIEEIERLIGNKAKIKYMEKQKGDMRDTWADVNKAKKELGWMSTTDIYKGIEKIYKNGAKKGLEL